MRSLLTVILGAVLVGHLAGCRESVDLLELAPKETRSIVQLDVRRGLGSSKGRTVVDAAVQYGREVLRGSGMVGIEKDIHKVLVAMPAGKLGSDHFLVLVSGHFNPDKLQGFLRDKGLLPDATYGGIVTFANAKKTAHLAFLGRTVVAFGDTQSLKATVDRWQAGGASVKDNPATMALVGRAETSSMLWAVGPYPAALSSSIKAQNVIAFVDLKSGLDLGVILENASAAGAETTRAATERILAQVKGAPVIARSGLALLLDQTTLTVTANDVFLRLALSEAQMEQLAKRNVAR